MRYSWLMSHDLQSIGDHKRVQDELSRLEEDLLYTEKAHFAAAEVLGGVHVALGLVATLASAATATTLLGGAPTWLSGVLALAATLTSGVLTFLKPEKRSNQHLQSGRALGRLRVRIRQARLVELPLHGASSTDLFEWVPLLKDLADLKAEIEGAAPATTGWMFQWARRKIVRGHFEHPVTAASETS